MQIFSKKCLSMGSSQILDRIRPPLVIFSAFLKKITMTRSSANFLSPEPNGQGYVLLRCFGEFYAVLSVVWDTCNGKLWNWIKYLPSLFFAIFFERKKCLNEVKQWIKSSPWGWPESSFWSNFGELGGIYTLALWMVVFFSYCNNNFHSVYWLQNS